MVVAVVVNFWMAYVLSELETYEMLQNELTKVEFMGVAINFGLNLEVFMEIGELVEKMTLKKLVCLALSQLKNFS